jgi:GTP pyrophosphokinase
MLHDTREIKHPRISITRQSLCEMFGHDVEADNHALTRKGYDKQQKEEKARYVSRLVRRGWQTVLVKLADRVDNLGTLQFQPREKWERIYQESVEYYLPLIVTLEDLLPLVLKPVAARVEKSLAHALRHAERLTQKLP